MQSKVYNLSTQEHVPLIRAEEKLDHMVSGFGWNINLASFFLFKPHESITI